MAIKPLAELEGFDLVNSEQDCRGWVVADDAGKRLGTVNEMLVDTDNERVTALVLDSGEQIPARNVSLEDGKVIVRGTAALAAAPRTAGKDEVALPVIEEEIKIGKRDVERGGVRVSSHVTERPVEETVTLREESVKVERRPADRAVSRADAAAVRGGTIEMTETSEEAVVGKQARVVEEVVVSKDVQQRTETVHDTVRRADVEVEKIKPDAAKGKGSNR